MTPVGPDLLRLSFCPACRYPLAGLSPAGRCPECGGEYDARQPVVVLRGHQPGERLLLAFITVPLVVAIGVLLWPAQGSLGWVAGWMAALTGLAVASLVARRIANPWPNPFLLWLSPAGCGVRSTLPVETVIRRVSLLCLAVLVLIGAAGAIVAVYRGVFAVVHASPAAAVVTAGVVFLYVMVVRWTMALMYRCSYGTAGGRRRSTAGGLWAIFRDHRPAGRPPALLPWRGLDVVTVRPCRDGRHRFTAARRVRRWTVPVLQVDVDLSPAAADALRFRLAVWRDRGR